jgi:hypothetical protein
MSTSPSLPETVSNVESLTSLAMLKVNSDVEGRDYVDYFIPFIGFVLDRTKLDPVTAPAVQQLLKTEFGLTVPQHPTEFALRRLLDRGFLRRDQYVYRIAKPVPIADIEARRGVLRQQHEAVVEQLRQFSIATDDSLQWSVDDARNALLSYLRRFSIESLRVFTHGSPLPPTPPLSERGLLAVNLFLKHIYETDRSTFNGFITLVKGHMLANALVCSDLKSITRNFGTVAFYFDTPLALRLLGLEGEARAAAVGELVELLRKLNGHCAIFEHTIDECRGVIESAERNLDNPAAHGRVIEEMRRRGTTKSDLQLLGGRFEELLRAKGIGRRRTPKYDANTRFQIDEAVLEEAIADEIEYMNPRALAYDINSVRSVYALRQNKAPTRLEDAIAVLVTSNAPLAKATFEYGRENESFREVAAVITDFSLANVAWLKAPLEAPDLPEVEIMAACYAALEPPPPLWKRYVTEIDKLRSLGQMSADDHQVLRHSPPARAALMNLTGGSERAFTSATVDDILDRMKADMRSKMMAELAAERESLLQADRERIRKAEEEHQAARSNFETAKADAEAARTAAIDHAERLSMAQRLQQDRVRTVAGRLARTARRVIVGGFALCVAATLITGAVKADTTTGKLAWVLVPILVVGLVLAYLDNVHELSVKKLGRWLEDLVRERITSHLLAQSESSDPPHRGPTTL